jgi:hypothetical protein
LSSHPQPDQPPPDPDRTRADGDPPAPVSGQPWSTPSGDPLSPEPYRPPATAEPTAPAVPAGPQPPTFKPGYAPLPPPREPDYPPTSEFPVTPPGPSVNYAPPGYTPDYGGAGHPAGGYPPPDPYAPPDPYLSGGGYPPPGYPPPGHPYQPAPAGKPPRKSSVPIIGVIVAVTLLLCGGVATAGVLIARNVADRAEEAVKPITELPTIDPDLPDIDPDLPGVPTEAPGLGHKITVTYEVTGDGPASQILYIEKLGETPKRLENVPLPWKFTAEMETPALLSVTALRAGTSEGTISCSASVDGDEVKQLTSDIGTFSTASCTHFALD